MAEISQKLKLKTFSQMHVQDADITFQQLFVSKIHIFIFVQHRGLPVLRQYRNKKMSLPIQIYSITNALHCHCNKEK